MERTTYAMETELEKVTQRDRKKKERKRDSNKNVQHMPNQIMNGALTRHTQNAAHCFSNDLDLIILSVAHRTDAALYIILTKQPVCQSMCNQISCCPFFPSVPAKL